MAIEFNIETSFKAAPDKVFAALTNVERFAEWMPGLVESSMLSDGEFGEGAEYQETRRVFFRNASERFRVTICEPPEMLELTVDGSKGSSRGGNYTFFYHLEADEEKGGTSMSMHGEISGQNKIMEFLGRFMMRFMARSIRKDYKALAKHLAASGGSE